MLKINNMHIRNGAFLLCLAFPILQLFGQDVGHPDGEDLSFKDRIAIRTNVVDWVLTTPNIAFDYDIVSTPYDKKTVGLNLKYNWNTSHTYIPKQVYNLFDMRLDYRFYWRQQPYDNRSNYYGDWEREWISSSKGFGKLRARANCFRAVEKPKTHLSLFVGPYLSFSSFSVKLSAADDALGRQGLAFGAGLTGGVALPLYGYENGAALDLEFGGSLGWHFASYDIYAVDVVNNEYPLQGHRNSFVFYPLVSDVRVSLVYRFRSISKQHTEIDYDLIDRRYIARLMEQDKESAKIYNDSIRVLKGILDKRNQEIALYKETVESEPGFIEAYSLEYLTPYMYMLDAPKKYTRDNKDTLPKIHIDSIEQITDPVMVSLRKEIDSIPHVTSEQIDKEFVNQYNNISDIDGKKVNRTTLIREIYTRLNSYIEDNNSKLVAGTFGVEPHSEKFYKYNSKQERKLVEIAYRDSVRTVEMTQNEKVEWLNSIKKKAWSDAKKRMQGEYVGRVEVRAVSPLDTLIVDSVKVDSLVLDNVQVDSLVTDSLTADSLIMGGLTVDTLSADSLAMDSLVSDSLAVNAVSIDSVSQVASSNVGESKAQKKQPRNSKRQKKEKVAKGEKQRASKADTPVVKEKKTKTKKTKKKSSQKNGSPVEVTDSIGGDSLVIDTANVKNLMMDSVKVVTDSASIVALMISPNSAWADDSMAAVFRGLLKSESYVLRNRGYFIKEEDED